MRPLIGRGGRRALAAVLLSAPLAWSVGPAVARGGAPLQAGAASIDVALPPGTPLAGYGGFPRRVWVPDILGRSPNAFWFRPSTGVHDPFKIRSLVLESGAVRVLWLTVDLVGIDPTLLGALQERLARRGESYTAVLVSASHTHSGPGAYGDSALFGFIALDRLSMPVRQRILDGLERAAGQAAERRAPALVASARSEVVDIAESRVHEALDPALGVVKVTRTDGWPVALLWNYAIHGTALGRDNSLLSGDLMAEASARLERQIGAPALYVNGAVGDVSPRPRGFAGVKTAGEALAAGALRAWADARTEPGRLEVARQRVALPSPSVAVRNCLGGWAPGWMTVGLAEWLPSSAELLALTIGRSAWVTIPGELETRLGLEIKASGRDRFSHVFIAGLSNNYLGYFLAADHYRRPSYIACGSLYGERGGEIVRSAAVSALGRLSAPDREDAALRRGRRPAAGRR
ncbi:MAG TPA: neutral/alkaline non-lysosomal ceramidase N-terminal domain-containing protein [Methylomirabilota bacterium]|nr:neutral/alkaline non-lysosomal ceramidase N-terminal domain-containing protein [Methylomirabilota bacterium]